MEKVIRIGPLVISLSILNNIVLAPSRVIEFYISWNRFWKVTNMFGETTKSYRDSFIIFSFYKGTNRTEIKFFKRV